MNRKTWIFLLLTCIIGCESVPPVRPNSATIIQEARESIERFKKTGSPGDCSAALAQLEKVTVGLEAEEKYGNWAQYETSRLKSKVDKLEDELSTWRSIKWSAFGIIAIYVIYLLLKLWANLSGVGSIGGLVSKFRPEK